MPEYAGIPSGLTIRPMVQGWYDDQGVSRAMLWRMMNSCSSPVIPLLMRADIGSVEDQDAIDPAIAPLAGTTRMNVYVDCCPPFIVTDGRRVIGGRGTPSDITPPHPYQSGDRRCDGAWRTALLICRRDEVRHCLVDSPTISIQIFQASQSFDVRDNPDRRAGESWITYGAIIKRERNPRLMGYSHGS